MAADAATVHTVRRFGVAGFPVAHSRSPAIHAAAYAALSIEADYQRLPVPPALFAETVGALPGSGFSGINVTIPHKHAALECADTATEAARRIGAANTLTFSGGRIAADNTDAPGMIAAIGRDLTGARALVLGAGGTARAAVHALTAAGAEVEIWNRTPSRASLLADEFGAAQTDAPARVAIASDLIVNTTALGMDKNESAESVISALGLPPELDGVPAGALLVDFVYRDGGSPLTEAASRRGIKVVDGLELLVRQAALSFEIWFGREAPLEAMRAAAAG